MRSNGMKHDVVYLQHIIDEINFVHDESKNLEYDAFIESEIYTRAFSRSIEVIGEAVKKLSPDLKEKHPEIEWKKISGMRDKLIHQYFNVDYDLLWDVIINKLPDVRVTIESILEELKAH